MARSRANADDHNAAGWLYIPVFWTLLVLGPVSEPPTQPTHKVILTWMVQPADDRTAIVTAIAIAVAVARGIAYALLGSRR
ncbi:hypothetical protein [Catellatospora tritici]|uniref:hypothetical protein n=1 Tax=Catellatospora tritici TaxID=2851566 RepID=UPI001C2D3447|nr:hypothetical protein [Catellatospora tritici]MBV1854319.1 hypothetical protein [Catellatospora tritici]